MENSYGIGVKNRYELLYSDIDPLEILKQQQEEKERRKNEKLLKEKLKAEKGTKQLQTNTVKKAPTKEPSLTNVTAKTETPTTETSKPRSKHVGDKSKTEEDNEEKHNRRNKEEKTSTIEARDRGDDSRRGKMGASRGGAGGGRGKGRGGRNNWDNHGKREYSGPPDRFQHAPKEKKDNSQAWSAPKESIEEVQSPVEDTQQEPAPTIEQEPAVILDATEVKAPEGEADATGLKEEEEIALKTMTLDEWKKEQENQRSVPKFNLRKPGEGEDTTQWKKLYQLKKKDGEAGADEEEEEDLAKKGRQKQVVEIQINFMDSRRRGGRGGRGHRGGGSSRGGSHKYERPQAAPKVDDWNDFPSLITA